MRRPITALLLALALGLAACADDEQEAAAGAEAPAATETATPEAQPADIGRLVTAISKDLDEKPQIPAPTGEPPDRLVTRDVVEGDGATAKPGDTVTVQYVGASWSNGAEFDASWDRGDAFEFQLGAGQVIPGWEEGVSGMKEGGRRVLVIPPDLAYGPQGSPPVIGPNETLVFVVDLVEVS